MSGESAVWTARIVPGESLPKTGSCRTACNACKSCFAHASVIFVALGAAGSEGSVLLARCFFVTFPLPASFALDRPCPLRLDHDATTV